MPAGVQPTVTLKTPPTGFLGLDTASEPTSIDLARSRRLYNAYQGKIRALTQRPGSVPAHTSALGAAIGHLMNYPFPQEVAIGAAPTLSAVADVSSTLPAATYYVRYTYVTDYGETEASAEASQVIASGQKLRVTIPAIPFHANSARVYVSTATNTEKLQGSTTTTTYDQSTPLLTVTAYPTTNTTEFRGEILAASGTTLYAFYNESMHAATMTNALVSSDIYDADFTNAALADRKIIADGGNLKAYNGAAVATIAPAADDPLPAPANALADINVKGNKFVWVHTGHVFVSPGTNEVFYSKRYEYDYFPETQYELLVRKGDYVNGCGVPFDNVQFIPMRRGWNVWSGVNFDDFDGSQYLNTINGVIAPRSIAILTYPGGIQSIAYLSDDGVHEIFTSTIDTQGRQYATRGLMKDKIDFDAYGFTEDEKEDAVAKYIVQFNMYLLEIRRDGTPYVFGYDTRNQEWYIWTGLTINSFLEWNGVVYFAGTDGFLKRFDADLYSDWTDAAMTAGTPVDFDRITGMIAFEDTGYPSALDYYILRLKQYAIPSSLDISIVYLQDISEVAEAIQNAYLIWDEGEWDMAAWANLNYSDLVAAPQRLSHRLQLPKKGHYFQIRWRNNRDEPVEIYGESLVGRPSGEV